MKRRDFLKRGTAAFSTASLVTFRHGGAVAQVPSGTVVNDVQSQLNATTVREIQSIQSSAQLQSILSHASSSGQQISIAGARHSMGGQQFGSDTVLLDMRGMNTVIGIDRDNKIVEVGTGIAWPDLIAHLNQEAPELGIIQKQSGADDLTLGGALACNAHGRGLALNPIISNVESFTLITADGNRMTCSRTENRGLFNLAIGGYGLFGVIDTVKLRLMRRLKMERVVEILDSVDVISAVDRRIGDGFLYGDFQYMTDAQSDDFLRKGVFSCYRPVADDTPIPETSNRLDPEAWKKLYQLAHLDKKAAFEQYRDYYLSTNGQVYWSDAHQFSTYVAGYNTTFNEMRGIKTGASLVLTELYVLRDKLVNLLENCRSAAIEQNMDVIYGTVRFIEKDDESFLPWAKDRFACVIFNLHVIHTPESIEKARRDFQRLIDEALALDGSYYLTYHRWARKDQVERAYPKFRELLALKLKYDSTETIQSDWYRHYKAMFAA